MSMDIKKILEVSTGEKFEYDTTKTWLDLFKVQTATSPEKMAVADENSALSYRELDELSDKVATWLIENGTEENKFVAIRMGRVKEFVAAVIGIWKIGAAYMPIDLDYPEERISYMLEDSESKITITEKIFAEIEKISSPSKNYKTSPKNLAYMIYTSGTTGKPKGVMIQHKALLNFVHFIKNRWALTENSRISCHSNFAFDASVEDLYPVLMTGGTLFIVPELARHDIFEMQKFIEKNKITGGGYTTRFGQILAAKTMLGLDYICVGGEAMTQVPNVSGKIFNTYGPTEFTVDATYFELEKGKTYNPIPIGRPLYNCAAFIVDKETKTKLLPLDEIGELCLAGPQIAAGYWKRPELTAEKFNYIKVGNEKVKVYHTGDLAKYNDEGFLEFYGRIDFQVKIRGYRVELPEIEEIIRHFEGIKDTVVVALDKPSGGKYIVAYVVSDKKVDVDALNNFIAKTKPPYMIPSFTVQIEKIPLNQNQKVDKKKLPIPKRSLEDYEKPETATEKFICEKMARALDLEVVGVNDDFFQNGGDSLTTIMLITECDNPGINISSIYQYRTPRNLAAYCDSLDSAEDIQEKNSDARKKPHPLNLSQNMYLEMFKENPAALYNNIPCLFRLNDDVDLEKMKDAVNKVMAHHPALQTKLIEGENGEYLQVYDEKLFKPIEITDLADAEFDNLKNKLVKPFAMTGGNFWRGRIYRTPSAKFLFLDFHHIISDGFSVLLILNELFACYQDENYKLPPDFYFYLLEAPEREKGTKSYEEAAAYCDKIFRGSNSLREEEMPLKPDKDSEKFTGAVKMFPLAIPKEKLRGNVAYLTACAMAVAAFNNSNRAVVRFTHYGRSDSLSLSSVGLFAGTYPMLLVREEDDTPETLIAKVQEQVSFVEAHINYPYFEGNISNLDRVVRFIYHKDITSLGDFEKLIQESIDLDTNNSDATDSLFGASILDESTHENLIFLERYAGNCYNEESEEKFRKLFIESAEYLAGIK